MAVFGLLQVQFKIAMKPKTIFYRTKARLAQGRAERLKKRYKDYDLDGHIVIIHALQKYKTALIEVLQNNFNADRCKHRDFRVKCINCECWKSKNK